MAQPVDSFESLSVLLVHEPHIFNYILLFCVYALCRQLFYSPWWEFLCLCCLILKWIPNTYLVWSSPFVLLEKIWYDVELSSYEVINFNLRLLCLVCHLINLTSNSENCWFSQWILLLVQCMTGVICINYYPLFLLRAGVWHVRSLPSIAYEFSILVYD